MSSYAPSVGLGSVVGDYSSRAYNRIYDLLSNLKGRAASYLSKILYHVNIVGRLDECESRIEEATTGLSNQIGALNQSLNVISETVGEYEGHMVTLREIRDILGEIANSQNVRGQLEKKRPVLENLLRALPKE